MASYLENPNVQYQAPVQTAPLQALVDVGMRKQSLYNDNVQRIQSQIDEAAALPVSRDVDVQYLNTSLANLGTELKKFNTADFSQMQVANSIAGMTTKISKDKNIRAAVYSTMNHQNELAQRDAYKKEGKTSASNDDDYNTAHQEYLNSTDLGRQFNYKYTPYTDVTKKAMEAIKALHPNLQKYDVVEKIVNGMKTGKMAEVMQSYKIEGVTENQIKQALMATLDSNDYNQLNIDGKYRFKGVDSEQLVNHVLENAKTQKNTANKQIEELKAQRALAISNPTKVAEIDDRISYYTDLVGSDGKKGEIDLSTEQNIENARKNPDDVKGSLYKNAFISQMANAFKWSSQEQKFEDSPFQKVYEWKQDFAFKQQVEKRIAANADRSHELELLKFKYTMDKDAKENALKNPDTPIAIGNETTQKNESVSMFNEHLNSVNSEMESSLNQMKNQGYSDKQISNAIASYKLKGNKAEDIPTSILGSVQQYLKNENYKNSLQTKSDALRKEAEQEVGFNTTTQDILKSRKPVTVGNITLTPKELLGIRNAESLIGGGNGTNKISLDTKGLNNNQIAFYKQMQGIRYTDKFERPSDRDARSGGVPNLMYSYDKESDMYSDLVKKTNDKYIEKLSPIVKTFVPTLQAIPYDKDGGMSTTVTNTLATLAKSGDLQKIAADGNTNMEATNKLLLDANNKNTRAFIRASGDSYELWLEDLKGGVKDQKYRLSTEQVQNMFGKDFTNKNSREAIRLELGRGNTNLQSDPNKSVLQTQYGDFPNISKMQVTADLQRDASAEDLYIPIINIRKKDGRYQSFEISGSDRLRRTGYEQGEQQLRVLDDTRLLQLIKQSYPNFDISTLDIK